MKKAVFLLALCIFALPGIAADAPGFDQKQIESLIVSIPTPRERERWKSMLDEDKKSDLNKDFAAKNLAAPGNCKKLDSQISAGKSIFDYPGLLTIGTLQWNQDTGLYTLWVDMPGTEFEYGGFYCEFGTSMIITRKGKIHIKS